MDTLTPEEKTGLAAFLNDEEGHYPGLSDLTYWWDAIPPEALDPQYPAYPERTILLLVYNNWSFTKHWAQEGLRQLLSELLKRREPIPEPLQHWAFRVAANTKPTKRPGRQEKADRNVRIMVALRWLRGVGYSQEDAMYTIADAIDAEYETVRSAVRKVENDRPFQKAVKHRENR